jgi:hypothetical protein
MFVLQSTSDPTLYYNGSTLNKQNYVQALFDPITNAREFETSEDAQDVADTWDVPVTIVEI